MQRRVRQRHHDVVKQVCDREEYAYFNASEFGAKTRSLKGHFHKRDVAACQEYIHSQDYALSCQPFEYHRSQLPQTKAQEQHTDGNHMEEKSSSASPRDCIEYLSSSRVVERLKDARTSMIDRSCALSVS